MIMAKNFKYYVIYVKQTKFLICTSKTVVTVVSITFKMELWLLQNILWKCCDYLEDLRPEVMSDTRSILLLLHTLVAFTANNTWAILRVPSMSNLRPGMSQLCANIMGHLVMRGFYIILKVTTLLHVNC